MRVVWLAVAVGVGVSGCAQQHLGQHEDEPSEMRDPHAGFRSDGGLHSGPVLLGPPSMASADAGWPIHDAGWAPVPDSGLRRYDASVVSSWDAPVPTWIELPQLVDPTGPCQQPVLAADTSGTCRDWRWHRPSCYRQPTECLALWESHSCITTIDGVVSYVGMDSGHTCQHRTPTLVPGAEQLDSLAQIGADLLTCNQGIVQKVALADGSFDTAALACDAVFEVDKQLIVHEPQSGSLSRYSSWRDTVDGVGNVIAFATPGALFAANSRTMVALWKDGNQLSLLTTDGSVSNRFWLAGFEGAPSGVDLTDDNQLFVATSEAIWVFDASTGAALDRVNVAGARGLVCQLNIGTRPAVPSQSGAPRPGAREPDRSDYILTAAGCEKPFQGPRYIAENGGPELLVVASVSRSSDTVRDERRAPHSLVLSSNDVASWIVKVLPEAQLQRILVTGMQTVRLQVDSARTIPVEYLTGRSSLGAHDGYTPGHGETMLRHAIEDYVGQPVSEVLGCFSDTGFVVQDAPQPRCVH